MNKKRDVVILIVIILVFAVGLILGLMPKEPYMRAYDNFNSTGNRFNHDFKEAVKEDVEDGYFSDSQKTPFYILNIGKDKTINNNTNIVLYVSVWEDTENKWMNLTPQEKKNDLRECARLVEEFLESKKIRYHYNIYIAIKDYPTLGSYVYNKTFDSVWIPNCEEKLKTGELDKPPLLEEGYSVSISDGELLEYGKEESTQY